MADHVYKLREVPKGQRIAFFWQYYRWPVLAGIVVLALAVSLLWNMFLRPRSDFSLLAVTGASVDADALQTELDTLLDADALDLNGDGRTEIFQALSNRKYEPIADQKGYLVNSIAAWCVRYSPTDGFSLDKTQMTDESPRQFKIKDHKIWLSQGLEAYILSNGELKLDKQ